MNGRSSDEHTPTPSSVEMKPVFPPDSLTKQPGAKSRDAKRKNHNISKTMIKRVEGGGVGLVNPMGWYDAERAESPRNPLGTDPSATIHGASTNSSMASSDSPNGSSTAQTSDDPARQIPEIVMDSPARMNSEEEE